MNHGGEGAFVSGENQGGNAVGGGSSGEGGTGASGESGLGGDGGALSEGGRAGEGGGTPLTTPSCLDRDPTECGETNPCLTLDLDGGTFSMGRSLDGPDSFPAGATAELPEHDTTINDYRLDKYEVTVGRFRRFVEAYDGTPPPPNAGAHPNVPGSGWQFEWDELLPQSKPELLAELEQRIDEWIEYGTWTPTAGENECLPMNYIDWYLAFAFCVWDHGRLPSEAEWEYAAAGGDEDRIYPWGDEAPTDSHAAFRCSASGPPSCEVADLPAVGSRRRLGNGRFGHSDLSGSLGEFVRDGYQDDWYTSPRAVVENPMNIGFDVGGSYFGVRGGDFISDGPDLRAVQRGGALRTSRVPWTGVRCARPR
jgi:formylglycine-generating enzyme required for sulfatase activity